MESNKKVRVKLYSDRKHYTVIEVYENEVESVKVANRLTWNEDKSEERKRIRLEENGVTICSIDDLDEDGSWIPDENILSPEEALIKEEETMTRNQMIEKAMSYLTAKQKIVVYQFYYEQKKISEIAEQLGVHFMSVQDCLDCAIKKMKKVLGNL